MSARGTPSIVRATSPIARTSRRSRPKSTARSPNDGAHSDHGPVMIDDPKVGWQVKLSVGPDGIGNDPAYLSHIMEESMEALIHHFKMVTQGVEVPPGEAYAAGAGRFSRIFLASTPGYLHEGAAPTVEDVAAHWEAINDGAGYEIPRNLMAWSASFNAHLA